MKFVCLVILFLGVTMSLKFSTENLTFPPILNKTIGEQKQLVNYFEEFVKTYQKEYKDQSEFQKRFEIFLKNHEKVKTLNLEAIVRGENTTFSINKFSDFEASENKGGHMTEVGSNARNLSDAEVVKQIEKNLEP
ncbi:unnamed protein product [Caenorhabditis angaria]|uniref:Cathepsin propeptide inhibitor domain-containing protein n=1 Tax=Caenorhabditis angaria TaxID=860376 RepID=A0A9P1IU22_9PELO|nr:unnamed protein product [Caenorhabditis angaria]